MATTREIKRRIQRCIMDADTVAKFATALKSLDFVRERENDTIDDETERMILMLPMESKAPGDPEPADG